MDDPEGKAPTLPPKPRPVQFGLRGMFVVTTLIAVALGILCGFVRWWGVAGATAFWLLTAHVSLSVVLLFAGKPRSVTYRTALAVLIISMALGVMTAAVQFVVLAMIK